MLNVPAHIWCKICGIRDERMAQACEQAGADAIGFMFYPPSARAVTAEDAAPISRAVACQRVGVFVNPTASDVETALRVCELDLLQFHGSEDASFCAQFDVPYMKVLSVQDDMDWRQAEAYSGAWALMLDTYDATAHGGTGIAFDWSLWPGDLHPRMVLSGGLDATTVGSAIKTLKPFGVDVSSGVEGEVKGQKDESKIHEFLEVVRDI